MASLNAPDFDIMDTPPDPSLQRKMASSNTPDVDAMKISLGPGSQQTASAGNITFVNPSVSFNQSQLNSIGGNFIRNSREDSNHGRTRNHRPTISSAPPSAPQIFFGRDDYVNEAVQIIKMKAPARLAILGTGGIGKTSTALAILHHKETKAIFGRKRYFMSCESLTSSAELLDALMQVFHLDYIPKEHAIDTLVDFWDSASKMLLVLDNFEALWGESYFYLDVKDILERIAGTENVTLIITMRGSLIPEGILWHEPSMGSELQPFSLNAASDTFLAINPKAAKEGPILNELLQEMDCIPLAVTLLAYLSRIESCSHLLERWEYEKTKLLSGIGHSKPNCLTSVEVSILISLNSLGVKSQAQTTEFLAMLSNLPDGIVQWKETLGSMTVGFYQPEHIVQVLLGAALIYEDSLNGSLKLLSPIKHYILGNYILKDKHLQVLKEFYVEIINQWKAEYYSPHFTTSEANLLPQYKNIAEILSLCINNDVLERFADHILAFGQTLHLMHVSTQKLLEKLAELLNNQFELNGSQAWCRTYKLKGQMLICSILQIENKYQEAKEKLEDAKTQFSDIGDKLGQAWCLQSLGRILQMESKYPEAKEKLEDVTTEFSDIEFELSQA